ncbi:MAG: HupE/UreJ family protein [Pseudohongiellaceae bacterium]
MKISFNSRSLFNSLNSRNSLTPLTALTCVALLLFPVLAVAHTIAGQDASFVEATRGPAVFPFMYLGAKHMVTGYDHLLFLAGVIFFLYRPRHVVQYVTLFAIGHSITLLLGVLADLRVNPYFIDAVIGLSIVYKAFENMDGFKRLFGRNPNTRVAVFIFGLFHGLGLATRLQEFNLASEGLVTNIISFNIGVEIGQVLALSVVFIALSVWRTHAGFLRHAFAANTVLMTGGFILASYQFSAFLLQAPY